MPDPYLVLALLVPGPIVFALCMVVFKAALRRQDGEEPGELSMVDAHKLSRDIERRYREASDA